jgi:hypothetical protein
MVPKKIADVSRDSELPILEGRHNRNTENVSRAMRRYREIVRDRIPPRKFCPHEFLDSFYRHSLLPERILFNLAA